MKLWNSSNPSSLFRKQLERQALKRILILVVLGCLLFCIPVFGLNYLDIRFNIEEHLDFLNRTYNKVYAETVAYLEDDGNEDMFLRCMSRESDSKEVQYSLNKYNVSSLIHLKMILMDRNREIVYTNFGTDEMNLHRLEFNKIVAENSLKTDTIYNTVYYFSGNQSEYVFVKPFYRFGSLAGFVTLYLDGSDWDTLVSEYQYDSIITNLDGDIIYCSNNAFLPERNTNKFRSDQVKHTIQVHGIQYITGVRVLPDRKAILYSFVYSSESSLYVGIGIATIVLLGGIWLIMFLKLSKIMAEKTTQSVETLVKEIRIIRNGHNKHVIHIETGDEFEEIATQINKMVESINELNTRNTDLIRLNGMIEMRNLQTQINPHFIYNTLDNIKYLIITDAKKASYLLEKFTRILRYSINNTKQNVFLSEDIRYIKDYLYIQKTRFGERFQCNIEIEEDCNHCKIPKLLLQPLIENSIKYGFQKKMYLSVEINAWCDDNYIFLRVKDDGPGVSQTELQQLQSMIVSEGVKTEHNGLQNLCRRIILEYGSECGLFIDSIEGQSFTVTAKLLRRGRKNV